mgnify:CR=1 FL=1
MAQVKRMRRNVSGIILLDKPIGFTSNAALQKVRWLLNAEKAGHTGSLDPLATGVLPLCFGEATKFSQTLLDADKADAIKRLQEWIALPTVAAVGNALRTARAAGFSIAPPMKFVGSATTLTASSVSVVGSGSWNIPCRRS